MKLSNITAIIVGLLMLYEVTYADVGAGYSGSWYNEDQSGHGFNIEYGETADGTGYMVAYWYIYDTDGNPMFLVGVAEPEGNTVEIAFDAPYGMVYGNFDPDAVVREDAGVGTFTFVDSDNGEFDFVPSTWMVETYGVSPITVPITKLFDVAHPNPELIEVLLERQGIQGVKGDAGPMGPRGLPGSAEASGLLMQNGNGQLIGTLLQIHWGGTPPVYSPDRYFLVSMDGYFFEITMPGILYGYFFGPDPRHLYFKSTDCSGEVLIGGMEDGADNTGVLFSWYEKLFVRDWGTPHVEVTYNSYLDGTTCRSSENTLQLQPVREVNPTDYGLEQFVASNGDQDLRAVPPIKLAVAK